MKYFNRLSDEQEKILLYQLNYVAICDGDDSGSEFEDMKDAYLFHTWDFSSPKIEDCTNKYLLVSDFDVKSGDSRKELKFDVEKTKKLRKAMFDTFGEEYLIDLGLNEKQLS